MKKQRVYDTTKAVRAIVKKVDIDVAANNWDAVKEGFAQLGAVSEQFDLEINAVPETPAPAETPAEDLI